MEETTPQHSIQDTVNTRIWRHTIVITVALYIFFIVVNYFLYNSTGALTFTNALAGTAALLFAGSFSLSGLCYYFDFLDTKIMYRKNLGIAGFLMALAYSISLLFTHSEVYWYGFTVAIKTPEMILGIVAMAYFTFMALISNKRAMQMLGPQTWRRLLRGGYFAWVLLGIRAYILEKDVWNAYVVHPSGIPPLRLLLSVLIILVILLRISLEISKRRDILPSDNSSDEGLSE